MATIKIKCNCGRTFEVTRDKEAPADAISMGCNYCPECEDLMTEDYSEWYKFKKDQQETIDPNQTSMFK